MAAWLGRQLAANTRILVSPAVRTQQTAKALERKFKTVDELAPRHSAQALLDAARWPDAREPVLVVGHQPTLGMTAALLMRGGNGGEMRSWTIRKGGVLWLRGRERDGAAPQVLHVALAPEMVQVRARHHALTPAAGRRSQRAMLRAMRSCPAQPGAA
ncbi:MAG: histidine phosphatase family protein [Rubrivivax sp.]